MSLFLGQQPYSFIFQTVIQIFNRIFNRKIVSTKANSKCRKRHCKECGVHGPQETGCQGCAKQQKFRIHCFEFEILLEQSEIEMTLLNCFQLYFQPWIIWSGQELVEHFVAAWVTSMSHLSIQALAPFRLQIQSTLLNTCRLKFLSRMKRNFWNYSKHLKGQAYVIRYFG